MLKSVKPWWHIRQQVMPKYLKKRTTLNYKEFIFIFVFSISEKVPDPTQAAHGRSNVAITHHGPGARMAPCRDGRGLFTSKSPCWACCDDETQPGRRGGWSQRRNEEYISSYNQNENFMFHELESRIPFRMRTSRRCGNTARHLRRK